MAPSVVDVHPLSNYAFLTKEQKPIKNPDYVDPLAGLKRDFREKGMRTSVKALLLVHDHKHPHLLLLKTRCNFYKLPGGHLKSEENEIDCLKRKLSSQLLPDSPIDPPDWQIGECVSMWWRPNFETVMYPYCPPHITKPKECRKLYLVHLPERLNFVVPRNYEFHAVSFFNLYDNVEIYGHLISAIPQIVSGINFNMENREEQQ